MPYQSCTFFFPPRGKRMPLSHHSTSLCQEHCAWNTQFLASSSLLYSFSCIPFHRKMKTELLLNFLPIFLSHFELLILINFKVLSVYKGDRNCTFSCLSFFIFLNFPIFLKYIIRSNYLFSFWLLDFKLYRWVSFAFVTRNSLKNLAD